MRVLMVPTKSRMRQLLIHRQIMAKRHRGSIKFGWISGTLEF